MKLPSGLGFIALILFLVIDFTASKLNRRNKRSKLAAGVLPWHPAYVITISYPEEWVFKKAVWDLHLNGWGIKTLLRNEFAIAEKRAKSCVN